MDEWSFITLAKTKSDLALAGRQPGLTKAETAQALAYGDALDSNRVRGILAFATASLLNAAFLGAVESSTLHAHTPKGDVIVAEIELEEPLPKYAALELGIRK